jgi:exonuclease SbcC
MILHRLEFGGVSTAFPGTVAIDFDALGPGLIAFVGDNGNGKSHGVELSGPATLFREFPSYGGDSFASHIHPSADLAHSTLTFAIGGDRYELAVKYDPSARGNKGQTRATLKRNGELIAGPERLGDVDAELAKILPSREVMLASSFASQSRSGSFRDLSKVQAKALFMELLGLGRLEQLADAAKAKRQAADAKVDTLRPRLQELQAKADRFAELSREIDEKTVAVADLSDRIEDARAAQTLAVEEHAAAREALGKLEVLADQYTKRSQELREALATARLDEAAALRAVEVNKQALVDEAGVYNAYDRFRQAEARLANLNQELEALREQTRPIETELSTLAERRRTLINEYRRLEDELQTAEAAETRIAGSQDLEAEVLHCEERRQAAQDQLAGAEKLTAGLEDARSAEDKANIRRERLEERKAEIEKRTGILEAVDVENPMCSACPLTADVRAAIETMREIDAEIEALPPSSRAAIEALREHRAELTLLVDLDRSTATELSEAKQALAKASGDIEKAAKAPQLRTQVEANITEGRKTRDRISQLEASGTEARAALARMEEQRTEAQAERDADVELADRFADVRAARAQHDQVEATHRTATARRETAEKAVADLGEAPRLTEARTTTEAAAAKVATTNGDLAKLQAQLTPVSETLQRQRGELSAMGEDPTAALTETQAKLDAAEEDAADYSQLERAFGKDGIQALEIDAAGPSVTAIANDLLATCYGTRFQLRIDTTEPTAKGDKVKEIFEVKILDAESPEGDRKSGSGGEQAILDEALRMAIAIFNTQRSGHEMLTLWRDETGGALSPENASRYVHMLRRARDIGGFHQVLFISHSEAVWSQADRQLFFGAGTVTEDRQAVAA